MNGTRALVLLACCLVLPGCGAGYLLQAARGQMEVVAAQRPIAQVTADPATPEPLRRSLGEVTAARDFAVRELGLPDNASYRSYADLGRPFVVWSVVAAPEFSVEPLRWCFPVAGCVAYRGYFSEAAAQRFALGLRVRGHDAIVGGVPAYSTLGRFADPVLSTMLRGDASGVIGTLFHELAHQLLYVPGDSSFNEAFAVVVELEGLERWWRLRGDAAAAGLHRERLERQAAFNAEVAAARGRLAELYTRPGLTESERRSLKALLMLEIAEQLRARGGAGVERWLAGGLDNAKLASVATYWACVPGLQRLLREEGDDLTAFYAAVRRLAGSSAAAQRRQLCGDAAASASAPQDSRPAAAR